MLIAKKDIHFSNSMVEVVFRQLKQKFYLKHAKSYKSLNRIISKFVFEYNNIIPHSSLGGATPKEKFLGIFDIKLYVKESRKSLLDNQKKRLEEFKACTKCIKMLKSSTD